MAITLPPIKQAMPLVDAAIATGKFNICPEASVSYPDISEPLKNPDRNANVLRWNNKTLSFGMPDGAAIFCELLQSSDPSTPFNNPSLVNINDWTGETDEDE